MGLTKNRIIIAAAITLATAVAAITIIKLKNTSTLTPSPNGRAAKGKSPKLTHVANLDATPATNVANPDATPATNVANPAISHVVTAKCFNNAQDCLKFCLLTNGEKVVLKNLPKLGAGYEIRNDYRRLERDEYGLYSYGGDSWALHYYPSENSQQNRHFRAYDDDDSLYNNDFDNGLQQAAILYKNDNYADLDYDDHFTTAGILKYVDWCAQNNKKICVFIPYL
ncbi:MAG: hypothetical protein LBR79_07005 [Oscillospiraceae bacterium]|jgi:hypothetical protein|nr:hypothetical protein [Oscillospiraceae bacterium]